ncbi:hypothetical protein GCM10025790_07910 [Nesterenkonia rhizosphaerae]|uniref:Uncharacterized protein n=1 Tax=Nesterenkonia rhizosphaerae TaxID=1348272 RepID=A0ABP9FTA0_9MICC
MLDHHNPVIRVLSADRFLKEREIHGDLPRLPGDQYNFALNRQQLEHGIDDTCPGGQKSQSVREDASLQVRILPLLESAGAGADRVRARVCSTTDTLTHS